MHVELLEMRENRVLEVTLMADEDIRETLLTGHNVFDGKIIHVEHWTVRLPNGREALREICVHMGAAAIVPVFDNGDVLLVRQSRAAIDEITWEIPAGKRDGKDENPLLCAKRELEEETGLHAQSWQLLSCVATTPGFCNERIWIYMARDFSQCAAHTDEDEFIHTERVPLDEAVHRVMRGEIIDSKTIAGLLMAQRALAEGDPS